VLVDAVGPALRSPALPAAAVRLVAPLAALHVAMFFFDLLHPERFLSADRAGERLGVIQGLAQSNDLSAYLAAHGIVGDWLPHALLYLAGGQPLVVAVQIVLALLSALWVMQLGRRLGLDERAAGGAALLYALLPHSLVYPHQLATEAIFVPLVILSFRLAMGAGSGLALGLATLIRPITLLWPFIHSLLRPGRGKAYLALALAPLLLWMSFIFFATGEFSMGRSGHDLGNNLYFRLQRMAADVPEAQRPPERGAGETKATLGEYVAFVVAHPAVTAKYAARDFAVLGFKSGIERVVLDYLNLYPEARGELQAADGGWRSQVDRGGVQAILELVRKQPALVGSAALGAVGFTVLMLLALYGALRWVRTAERLALVVFVLYIFATSQVVDAAQSRLRAPAEFALCILAVAGWLALRQRGEKHVR
jgi:hypothetical protein